MEQVTDIYLDNFSLMFKMDSVFEGFCIFLLHLSLKKVPSRTQSFQSTENDVFFFFNIY